VRSVTSTLKRIASRPARCGAGRPPAGTTGRPALSRLITAAVAEYHDAIVLHYDADFEQISAATGQAQVWVAPRGSLD
jgi:predicted nucleic acid-binding protein